MEKINLIFKELMLNNKSEYQEWVNNYALVIEDVEIIREGLLNSNSFDNESLYSGLKTIKVKNYKELLFKLLIENSNGIASDKISTNRIKGAFDEILKDNLFKDILKRIFLDENGSKTYEETKSWWKEFCKINKLNFYISIINRLFAAIHYKKIGTTINESNYDSAEFELKKICNYDYDKNKLKNWYDRNIELMRWLSENLDSELKAIDNSELRQLLFRNIFVWEIYSKGSLNIFSVSKQIIKYGAPGTGKTYTCKVDTETHFNYWKISYNLKYDKSINYNREIIQFHPSFTYEDFIEGLRPVPHNQNTTILKLVNGIFKNFCLKAYVWERDVYQVLAKSNLEELVWNEMKVSEIINKVNGEHWDFLKQVDENEYLYKLIPPFYFIIDEINRGELSRILGELMYCLEYRGYNGKSKTQYSQLSSEDNYYLLENNENYFYVPHNVYILGTMNTIDRSVESFDFALRRRFHWQEMEPNYNIIRDYNDEQNCKDFNPLIENIKELNKSISSDRLLGKDYQIGHSYFMTISGELADLRKNEYRDFLWNNKILPLLEEYLRGVSEPKEITNKLNNFKEIFYKKIKNNES